MIEKILKGKLTLYSEQGMEGGYLAVQNAKYIKLKESSFGITNNVTVWDKKNTTRIGTTSDAEIFIDGLWRPIPDPIYQDTDFLKSSLNLGKKGSLKADSIISKRYNLRIKYVDEILNEKFGENKWKYKTETKSEIILNTGEVMHIGYTPVCEPKRPYNIPQGALTRITVKWNDGQIEKKLKSNTLLIEQWDLNGLNMLSETDVVKVKDPITNETICENRINAIPLRIFSQTAEGHFRQCLNKKNNWRLFFKNQYFAEIYREKEK